MNIDYKMSIEGRMLKNENKIAIFFRFEQSIIRKF